MTKKDFLLLSLFIFLIQFAVMPILRWRAGVDLFVVFVLTLSFLDRNFSGKFFLVFISAVIFDIFSGGTFGAMTFAVLMSVAVVSFLQKIFLTSGRNVFFSFIWLAVFYKIYQFFLFVPLFILQPDSVSFGWANFSFFNLFSIALSVVAAIAVCKYYEKRISHF